MMYSGDEVYGDAITSGMQDDHDYVRCPSCGSTADPEYVFYDGSTGVVAPDGGKEQQHQEGWKCPECGAVEEI